MVGTSNPAPVFGMRQLILASTSPSKNKLLSETGLLFEAVASDYEEDMSLPMPPRELIVHLAKGKAQAVAVNHKDAVVIGADTFLVFEDKILGKPHTPEKAIETLRLLSGKSHSVLTGFVVMCTAEDKEVSGVVETKVFFKPLTEEEITEYVATSEPLERAGAYAIQGLGKDLVDRFEGDYTNVMGFPVKDVLEVLKEFEIVTLRK